MSQPFKLYRLQQIDSQLDRARNRLQAIETALNENEALNQAQKLSEAAEKDLEDKRKALRQAEDNVQSQRIKIEQTEATLYGGKVRNPKELQDLQNEIQSLQKFRTVLEDRQLEAMIAAEESEVAAAEASRGMKRIQAELIEQHAALIGEQSTLKKEEARLEGERKAALSSIPEGDLNLYQQLRQSRRGIAVAKVSDKACAACGSTLNAALLQAASSPNHVTRCESCGRILYSP